MFRPYGVAIAVSTKGETVACGRWHSLRNQAAMTATPPWPFNSGPPGASSIRFGPNSNSPLHSTSGSHQAHVTTFFFWNFGHYYIHPTLNFFSRRYVYLSLYIFEGHVWVIKRNFFSSVFVQQLEHQQQRIPYSVKSISATTTTTIWVSGAEPLGRCFCWAFWDSWWYLFRHLIPTQVSEWITTEFQHNIKAVE